MNIYEYIYKYILSVTQAVFIGCSKTALRNSFRRSFRNKNIPSKLPPENDNSGQASERKEKLLP